MNDYDDKNCFVDIKTKYDVFKIFSKLNPVQRNILIEDIKKDDIQRIRKEAKNGNSNELYDFIRRKNGRMYIDIHMKLDEVDILILFRDIHDDIYGDVINLFENVSLFKGKFIHENTDEGYTYRMHTNNANKFIFIVGSSIFSKENNFIVGTVHRD